MSADGVRTADGTGPARWSGDAVVGNGVVGIDTVEEFQVEGGCRLAIDCGLGAVSRRVSHDGRATKSREGCRREWQGINCRAVV